MSYLLSLAKALLGIAMVFFVASAALSAPSLATTSSQRGLDNSKASILEAYGQLPLSFEANQGQADSQVRFLARGQGYGLFLTATEAMLDLPAPQGDAAADAAPRSQAVLRTKLLGGNSEPQITGQDMLPGKVNYFLGNAPERWRTNIPTYAKVAYQDVYPGIDLIYYGNQGQLEYDFIVAPGANPASIGLSFAGADSLAVDAQGDLVLRTSGGEVRQRRPFIYQERDGVRQEIAGRYVLTGQDRIGFALEAYDPARPLVIDPILVYSTFLGGNQEDVGLGIAVDSARSAYITGRSPSSAFPTTTGAFDTTFGGTNDAFVTKLNASGSALVYSTYLGGSGGETGFDIALDSAGSAYVTGDTTSTNFPITTGTFGGLRDAFVTKLNASGSALVYSTYLGGSGVESGLGITVDSAGSVYVTGETVSNFPTTTGAYDTSANGSSDAFLTKFNPNGTALVYSTYLGQIGADQGLGIVVDSGGNTYVTGKTSSAVFPTLNAFDTSLGGGTDGFVTKFNANGSALLYSTYLGGGGSDQGNDIALDNAGSAYVVGEGNSTNFPTTPNAFDTSNNGSFDAFVTKFSAGGSTLVYSTYLGGSGSEQGFGIALDSDGSAYVTGRAASNDFPTTPGTLDTSANGSDDAFVTKLNASGSALAYSTYLGGSGVDQGNGIAVDSAGNTYVIGQTNVNSFPTTPGAFDTSFNGSNDAFVAKLRAAPIPTMLTLAPAAASNLTGAQHCLTATVTDQFGDLIASVIVHFAVMGTLNTSGSATTDPNGQASFCYTGTTAAGTDTITVYADTDADNTQDSEEPSSTATNTWVAPTPPNTTIDEGPASLSNSASTSFSFSSNEASSTFQCKLYGGDWIVCASPVNYNNLADGNHTFEVRAVNQAGDVDPTSASRSWRVDTAAPETTIESGPDTNTNSANASFAFSSSEEGSSFECSLDSGAFTACASSANYNNLADGSHSFEVRATDAAGNADPTPASRSWRVDTAAPETTIESGPDAITNSTIASFTFSSSEEGSSFECSLDSGAFTACASPVSYTGLADGSHAFKVRSTDTAGNVDPTSAGFNWTVDTVAGDTVIDSAPDALTNSQDAILTFHADSGDSFECRLDGGAFAVCTSPSSYSSLADGSHTFSVRSKDAAGNLDPTPASFSWTVDTAAPDTMITNKPTALTNSASASFEFSSTKIDSTFECKLDSGNWATCTSPSNYNGLAGGSHTFYVRATDAAGNIDTTPASFSWVVDTTAPDTTIVSGPSNPTSGTSASFSFTSSEASSAFECSLDGGPFVSCGSLKSYSNLGLGNHTFEVRATDAAGNTDTTPARFTWTIVSGYAFTGFFQPIDNLPTLNINKAGSAIPVKFSLGGDFGLNIFEAGYPKSVLISCQSGAPTDLIETTTNSPSGLSYDTRTGQYTYVWKTDKTWTGCHQLIVRFNDGSEQRANFKFSK